MKVLYFYRGYGTNLSNSVIDFQAASLSSDEIEIEKFPIRGGGVKGYLSAAFQLKKRISETECNLVHAHYSFSGFIAGLVSKKPVVCSLMGSDVLRQGFLLTIVTKLFYKYFWTRTVVKSVEMHNQFPKAVRIPNGVDFENFKEISKAEAVKKVGFNPDKKNIIFVAQDPSSTVKNYQLAEKSLGLLNNNEIKLHIVSNKDFTELPFFYNAADLLLLTSLSEGSPNVIKEAMACNTPIVATNVGDVKEIIGNTEGTFISSFEPNDVANKIHDALKFGQRTKGRMNISHLSTEVIAEQISSLYNSIKT